MIEEFYVWLENSENWEKYFSDPVTVKRVSKMQVQYWEMFFVGKVDAAYIDNRRFVGEVHARINLPLSVYFAGVMRMVNIFFRYIDSGPEILALNKLVNFDMAQTVESYNKVTSDLIYSQTKALSEMSTPITSIWDGILMLPICGIIDSVRAQDLMTTVLNSIRDTESKVVILDISGVPIVDTAVANHIIKISRASKLMGCLCIISGVAPTIAQTIVELGIDVNSVLATSTLQDSMTLAFEAVGVRVEGLGGVVSSGLSRSESEMLN
jgi:rsbT co-antagonist protein RsbR